MMFLSVPTVQMASHHSCWPYYFCSVCTHVQSVIGCRFSTCKKMLIHSPTRINSCILLQFSKLAVLGQFTTTALRFWASSVIETQLGLKSAIGDQSTSCCQLTLIASKCESLVRAMLLLAFLGCWGILATMGVVHSILSHRPLPVLFPLLCMRNGCLLYSSEFSWNCW